MPRKRKASELGEGKQGKTKKRNISLEAQKSGGVPAYKAYPVLPHEVEAAQVKGLHVDHVKLADGFEWDYVVKSPPQLIPWADLRKYRNVKLTDSVFSTGDIIYVSNNERMPPPPRDSAPDSKHLKYEQDNYWVAKIVEARANSDKEVWLLVAWLYWPKELPNRRDHKFYGQGETVLSNFLDIVDAMSIVSKVDELLYYNEWENEMVGEASTRFWRQTFDTRHPDRADNLSQLRTFCICRKPHQPDTKMYFCANAACNEWLHADCLSSAVGEKVWPSYQDGTMDEYAADHKPKQQDSFAKTLLQPVKAVGHFITGSTEAKPEEGVEAVEKETSPGVHSPAINGSSNGNGAAPSPAKKQGRPPKNKPSWRDRLRIKILAEEGKPLYAKVEEKSGKRRSWEVKVDCLCCGQTMD